MYILYIYMTQIKIRMHWKYLPDVIFTDPPIIYYLELNFSFSSHVVL